MKDALGLMCHGYRVEEVRKSEPVAHTLDLVSRSMRRLGAAVVEATWVASGRADYSLLYGIRPWDVAAGALIVKEAGGNVTTPKGKPWKLADPDILFSTPRLTKKIHSIIK
jgi:myo-inositol-1(or 4)-monophosphatase